MEIKVEAVIRQLKSDGWYLVRQKGSHQQYHHPSKPGTVTVSTLNIARGTLKSILRQAGLQQERIISSKVK